MKLGYQKLFYMKLAQYGCTIKDEKLKERQTHRKAPQQPNWKKDHLTNVGLSERQPHRKMTSQEDDRIGR